MAAESKQGRGGVEPQSEFERYEAKYIVHPAIVPEIRKFVRPFCLPDPNTTGDPPEYVITTMQLDAPTGCLHYAKEREDINRFKLRVRGYGTDGTSPLFLEIKRKVKGVILKSRVMVPRSCWGKSLVRGDCGCDIPFRNRHEMLNYAEFVRLSELLGAKPVVTVRYTRESYSSVIDDYARVTLDRKLCYTPCRSWDFPGEDRRWWKMDSMDALKRPFSGHILELKTYRNAPQWMIEMTERFNLVRTGFCKYSTAVRLETIFQGAVYAENRESYLTGVIGF